MKDEDSDLIPEPEAPAKDKPTDIKKSDLDFAVDKLYNSLNLPQDMEEMLSTN